MENRDNVRRGLAKEARLWLLALVCAAAGGITVHLTDSLAAGVMIFLGFLIVLGLILFSYERRHKK